MNIGIMIARFPPQATGGAEVQAMLMASLLARNNKVTVFTRRLDDSPWVEEMDGYTVVRTPAIGVPGIRLASDIIATRRAVGRRRRDMDVLLCFQSVASGILGAICKRSFGIPFVVWVRGQEEYGWSSVGGVDPKVLKNRMLVPWVLRSADKVLVQSEHIRGELKAAVEKLLKPERWRELSPKVSVMPTIVEPGEGSARHDGAVLFVGRLVKVKGVHLLIEAMRRLDGVRLILVGDGPERDALERASKGLDVSFEGLLPHREVLKRFRDAAVLVQPSLAEGMPNSVLEAMAHGLPVVATAVAGVPEIVRDGETGYLIDRRDPDLLASRLETLLGDRALWERMSRASRDRAMDFSPERVLPRLEAVLSSAIAGRGR